MENKGITFGFNIQKSDLIKTIGRHIDTEFSFGQGMGVFGKNEITHLLKVPWVQYLCFFTLNWNNNRQIVSFKVLYGNSIGIIHTVLSFHVSVVIFLYDNA